MLDNPLNPQVCEVTSCSIDIPQSPVQTALQCILKLIFLWHDMDITFYIVKYHPNFWNNIYMPRLFI